MTWDVRFRGETIPYEHRLLKQSTPSARQHLPEYWLGYDSEAAEIDGFPEVQTMQTYDGSLSRLEYVKSGDAWRHFWSLLARAIEEERFGSTTNRLPLVPVYCHNWEYDFGMLVKAGPEGWQTQSKMNQFFRGFEDSVSVEKTTWHLRVDQGHMLGNAPTLTVFFTHKDRGAKIRLLDTFPFFPKALATVAKDLHMEKGDRASVIGIDWRDHGYSESVTAKDEAGIPVIVTKRDFEKYAKHDALLVWTLGERIHGLHEAEGLTSLAVSGAGYAAKVMLANLSAPITGGHGGKRAVQLALDAFHGGRSGRLVHGSVSDVTVLDFHSSYPSIQIKLPALHSDYSLVYKHRNLDIQTFLDMAKRYHGFARVSGIEEDAKYPSLLSANKQGSIRPVVGEFHNIPATAAEIYCGVVFGGLRLTSVQEAFFYAPLAGLENVRPFEPFIQRAWARKNSEEKGSLLYDAAKIQANSGYGKLIEHRGAQERVSDSLQIPLRYGGMKGFEDARQFFLNIHPDYWFDKLDEWESLCGDTIAGYTNLDLLLAAQPEFGYYVVPQYATWITGHAHARLVLLMRALDAMKWDTDSVTTGLTDNEIRARLAAFPSDKLPDYIQPLSIGAELGELDIEGRAMSGVVLGNKRYFLRGEIFKEGHWTLGIKEGHHGLPAIRKDDIEKVLTGVVSEYTPKPKPIRVKGAQEWREVGLFRVGSSKHKTIRPVFAPDSKQDFVNGGAYKTFGGFNRE